MPQTQPARIQDNTRFHPLDGRAKPGKAKTTHDMKSDDWVSRAQTKPNAKAHDQTMAQWTSEWHRSEIDVPQGAPQLTDVNLSGVDSSRERA